MSALAGVGGPRGDRGRWARALPTGRARLAVVHCFIVLAPLLVAACAATVPRDADIQPPLVGLLNIHPRELGLFEQRYVLDLRIRNPNSFRLPIVGMTLRLTVNGGDFARGVSGAVTQVEPYGEASVSVDVLSSAGQTLAQIHRRARDQSAELTYALQGALRVRGREQELVFAASGVIRDGENLFLGATVP